MLRPREGRPGALTTLVCAGILSLHFGLGSSVPGRGTPAAAAEPPNSIGISVQPPVLWVPKVEPGVEVTLPAPITIRNNGTARMACTIEPVPASSLGMRSMPGYVDIPNPSWCKPERDTLSLAPGEAKSVEVWLHIPDAPCNYSRHWCAAFSVRTAGRGTFGAAAYPYVYVETVSENDRFRPPEAIGDARAQSPESPRGADAGPAASGASVSSASGCLMVTPEALDAGDVGIGDRASAGSVSVLNTLDTEVLLEVTPLVPEPGRLARRAIITPGHTWMRDADWLRPETRSLLVPAGEEKRFDVTVACPPDSTIANYRWEGFILAEGSDGSSSLVRVRWRTTPEPGKAELTIGRTRRNGP